MIPLVPRIALPHSPSSLPYTLGFVDIEASNLEYQKSHVPQRVQEDPRSPAVTASLRLQHDRTAQSCLSPTRSDSRACGYGTVIDCFESFVVLCVLFEMKLQATLFRLAAQDRPPGAQKSQFGILPILIMPMNASSNVAGVGAEFRGSLNSRPAAWETRQDSQPSSDKESTTLANSSNLSREKTGKRLLNMCEKVIETTYHSCGCTSVKEWVEHCNRKKDRRCQPPRRERRIDNEGYTGKCSTCRRKPKGSSKPTAS